MSKEVTVEDLYPLVTEAILRAETLEDLGAPGAARAYLDVSLLEEKITEALAASDPEGAIARRGAVRAALTAHEHGRAQELAERFLSENDADEELRQDLLHLAQQAEQPRVTDDVNRVEAVLRKLDLPTRAEISRLTERIEDIYRKLSLIESRERRQRGRVRAGEKEARGRSRSATSQTNDSSEKKKKHRRRSREKYAEK